MKNIFKSLNILKIILNLRREVSQLRFEALKQTRIQQAILKELLIQNYSKDNQLLKYEHQTFSQNGEDGIINEIFNRLGIKTGEFIEIGTGDGCENNTRLLLELGWKGVWIDGSTKNLNTINSNFQNFIKNDKLLAYANFVNENNINSILQKYDISKDVDLLSLDLDLTTHLVWESINYITPKVLVIEYNGFFPKNSLWKAVVEDNEVWDGSINMGASLSTIIKISESKGYKHIGCDITGTNAFFVLEELVSKYFSDFSFNPSQQPARPYIVNGPAHIRD